MNKIEYHKSLPKKGMGSGVLFLNTKNELLILKTTYKEHWTIPGGTVDKDESPRDAVVREVKEEIGLDISTPKFLGVSYKPNNGYGDCLQFNFYGGVLTDADIKSIRLQGDEIAEYKFLGIDEAASLLSPSLRRRLPKLVEAIKNNCPAYLEDGL